MTPILKLDDRVTVDIYNETLGGIEHLVTGVGFIREVDVTDYTCWIEFKNGSFQWVSNRYITKVD